MKTRIRRQKLADFALGATILLRRENIVFFFFLIYSFCKNKLYRIILENRNRKL